MAMTYTELKTNVQDITEMTFTDAQLSMFTKQVEQRIYGIIKDLPILRKYSDTASYNGTTTYTLPADCLYVHTVYQVLTGSRVSLIPKSSQFLREAYPENPETVLTDNNLKYYALSSSSVSSESASRLELEVAPRFNAVITIVVEYQYQPRSIVDTDGLEEQPWLGTNYDSALLNGVLVEAAKFMKAEPDMVQMYEQQFVLALQQIQNTVDVRLQADSYRPKGQPPKPIPVQPTPQQQE